MNFLIYSLNIWFTSFWCSMPNHSKFISSGQPVPASNATTFVWIRACHNLALLCNYANSVIPKWWNSNIICVDLGHDGLFMRNYCISGIMGLSVLFTVWNILYLFRSLVTSNKSDRRANIHLWIVCCITYRGYLAYRILELPCFLWKKYKKGAKYEAIYITRKRGSISERCWVQVAALQTGNVRLPL